MVGVNPDLIGRGRLFLGVRLRDQASLFGWVGHINTGGPDPAWKRSGTSVLARRLNQGASYAVGGCRTIAAFRSFPTSDRAKNVEGQE